MKMEKSINERGEEREGELGWKGREEGEGERAKRARGEREERKGEEGCGERERKRKEGNTHTFTHTLGNVPIRPLGSMLNGGHGAP